jgi:single-strand DNA-binding protein
MASDINSVYLTGNLTRDMELSYTQGGLAVGKFAIAVNRSVKKGDKWEDEASFFEVVIFGKSAEALKPYLTKGKPIALQGSLKQDRWQDKETGKTRSSVHVIAEHVKLGGGGQQGGQSAPAQYSAPPAGDGYATGDYPSDIPF